MKKSSLLLLPIVFLLILFIRQKKTSAEFYHIFQYEDTKEKIITPPPDIINTQIVNNSGFKYLLKARSEKIFSLICHQDRSRLIRINDHLIPLCPRCMGLHFGFFTTVCMLMAFTRKRIRICRGSSLYLLIFLSSLTGIEWSLAQLSIIRSTTSCRLLTGLATGSVFGILFITYKRGFILPASFEYQLINVPRITAIITVLLTGVTMIMISNSWMIIEIILLVSVIANFIIIIHTLILRFTPFMKFLIINHKTS